MPDHKILIRQFELGLLQNFVYFIGDEATREVMVIDPAWEVDTILRKAKQEDLKIVGALITHHHFDHTNGIEDLLKVLDIPIYINKHDVPYLDYKHSNLKLAEGGQRVKCGGIEIKLIHTPGHTPGSQCFHVHDNLVSGDTLFINACGRCDFQNSSPEEMYKSLHERIGKLSDRTILFPGHNYADVAQSTLGNERTHNPYLLVDSLKNFLRLRVGG